jgi:hypothetical protein
MDNAQIVNTLRTLLEESVVIPPQSEEQAKYLTEDFVKRLVSRANNYPEVRACSVAVVIDQLVNKRTYLYLEEGKLRAAFYPTDLENIGEHYQYLSRGLNVKHLELQNLHERVVELSKDLRNVKEEISKAEKALENKRTCIRISIKDHFYQFLLVETGQQPTKVNRELFNFYWESEVTHAEIRNRFKALSSKSE